MKIDIISGFLGAGKTTLIKKLIENKSKNEKLAIIENEFGDVSIDGDILKGPNIDIKEISSGCICCSIAGDFESSISELVKKYNPDRLIIEPSGVAKLSEIVNSIKQTSNKFNSNISFIITVIDVSNFDMYLDNFGEFYINQISNANTIVCTRVDLIDEHTLKSVVGKIRKLNKDADIIQIPIQELDGKLISDIASKKYENNNSTCKKNLKIGSRIKKISTRADKVFDSFGVITQKKFCKDELDKIFMRFKNDEYGIILRGKGFVIDNNGKWLEFHYTPGQFIVKNSITHKESKISIIGEKIDKERLKLLF